MMYTILIVACLQSAPAECRTYQQPATELSMLPTTAYIQAQTLVAQWQDKHPWLRVRGFSINRGRLA